MKDSIERLVELIDAAGEQKVIKSIPMEKAWTKKLKAFDKAIEEVKEAEMKRSALKRQFWAVVEEDTKIYGQMNINREDNTIDVLK